MPYEWSTSEQLEAEQVNSFSSPNQESNSQKIPDSPDVQWIDAMTTIDSVLSALELEISFDEQELNKIPSKGAFIVVSNQAFGGIDGLILLKMILKRRPDFKIVANNVLEKFESINAYCIKSKHQKNSNDVVDQSLQRIINHQLEQKSPLGFIPAESFQSYFLRGNGLDKRWNNAIVKTIKKANVPVVPIYLHANHNLLNGFISALYPWLRSTKPQSDTLPSTPKKIVVRIGSSITPEEQTQFKEIQRYGRFLRAKVFALGSALEVKRFFKIRYKKPEKQEPIQPEIAADLLREEVVRLNQNGFQLFESGVFKVYCAPSFEMPLLLSEIGRLREITFREVGEGTNRSTDLDEYDLYYQHLFIWDESKSAIVGAYRVGKGKEIIKQYGKKGFYIDSLFKIKSEMKPILEKSIELGRSFVAKSYQRQPVSLFLLWKGILYLLLKHEEYRYIIGPVSISNSYSELSKSLIIDFIENYYFQHDFARLIKPKVKFKVKSKNANHLMLKESLNGDINKLDKMIEDIEPGHFKVPVLFKKYLKQNARILGFNVDPLFNNALDGLMILDLLDVPVSTIQSLSKELKDKAIVNRFHSKLLVDAYSETPQF